MDLKIICLYKTGKGVVPVCIIILSVQWSQIIYE